MKTNNTDSFLEAVRARLAAGRSLQIATLVGAVTAGGYLLFAVAWRLTGYAVPWQGFVVAVVAGMVAWLAWTALRPVKVEDAAREADEQFGLKDGLSSVLGFEKGARSGGVFDLQRETIEGKIAAVSPEAVPFQFSGRLAGAGGVALVLGIFVATLPPGAAVQEKLDLEQAMLGKSGEVKNELEAIVEEILADLDEEEKEALDQDEVRAWLQELKETPDAKEALRQLARFEQKLAKSMAGLESREDEEAMKLAAAELARSDQSASRQLGMKLEAKEFSEAAKELEKLNPTSKKPMTPEERAAMAKKLREATRRLAKGANTRSQTSKMAAMSRALDDSAKNFVDLGEIDPDAQESKDCAT